MKLQSHHSSSDRIFIMKYLNWLNAGILCLVLSACAGNRQATESSPTTTDNNPSSPNPAATGEVTVIELTQVGCQFLEVEAQNYQYQPTSAKDCEKINSDTLASREAGFIPLELKPGKYIFRVTNSNVPYPLGFYLRGAGITQKVSLPKVSGGGLTQGVTKDYEITLTPGDYVFSCPLNPTPDYPITVNI